MSVDSARAAGMGRLQNGYLHSAGQNLPVPFLLILRPIAAISHRPVADFWNGA